jgi:hypothetical protein
MFLVKFDKIRQNHTGYNNRPSNTIYFMTAIASTSGSLHSECVCLLVQSYGREKAVTMSVGVGLHKKPTDLSASESEEREHGKDVGVYTTLLQSDTVGEESGHGKGVGEYATLIHSQIQYRNNVAQNQVLDLRGLDCKKSEK